PLVAAGVYVRGDFLRTALANHVAQGRTADQDFMGGYAPRLVSPPEKLLGDDGPERSGQHNAHLLLPARWKNIDYAVNGLGCRIGMQRAKDQDARLGQRNGQ